MRMRMRRVLGRDVHQERASVRIALIQLSSARSTHHLNDSHESRRGMEVALRMKQTSPVQTSKCARWERAKGVKIKKRGFAIVPEIR